MTLTLSETTTQSQYTNASLSNEIRKILLEEVIDGGLAPGNKINDHELAAQLGVSRTPVREAIRGLQALGLVEILPARTTRVATPTGDHFDDAKTVWGSLFKVVITDVIHTITPAHIVSLAQLGTTLTDNEAGPEHASAVFRFFNTLSQISENMFLDESVYAAACRLRLGRPHAKTGERAYLQLTFDQVHNFLSAITRKDVPAAHAVIDDVLARV